MSYIYLFEAFVNTITFPTSLKIQDESLEIEVQLPNLFSFVIDIVNPNSVNNFNIHCNNISLSGGKAVVFASNSDVIVKALEQNSITILLSNEQYGVAHSKLDPAWLRKVEKIGVKDECLHYVDKTDIKNTLDKKVASMELNISLYCYGKNIEVPLRTGDPSSLNIPINMGALRVSTAWEPLFGTKVKHTPSKIDSSMVIYAQMAGLEPEAEGIMKRLTAEYVNTRLCGYKTCPGALLFKNLGLGPLAHPGTGLGSVNAIKDAKPCGLYGMSQAYGTLEHYGAYGLFVNKNKATKSACKSPDCKYTKFFEAEERQSEPRCCKEYKNKLTKCICKCCGKKIKKFPDTCGDPICPSMPEIKSKGCKDPICPITGIIATESQTNFCGSPDCPYEPSETDPTCKGEKCPYSKKNISKCCIDPSCPSSATSYPRQSAGADRENYKCPYLTKLINSSDKSKAPISNLPNACNDPNCAWRKYHNGPILNLDYPKKVVSAESDWGKPTHIKTDKNNPPKNEEFLITKVDEKNCGDQECEVNNDNNKYKTQTRTLYEVQDNNTSGQSKFNKNVTLVVNDKGEKMLVSDTRENINFDKETLKQDFITLLSGTDDNEIYYMIATLLAKSKAATNNISSDNTDNIYSTSDVPSLPPKTAVEKSKKIKPCKKPSCKSLKYKACSECGGISRTGATCDNTDVSFSTVSYSEYPASLSSPAKNKNPTQNISKTPEFGSKSTENGKPYKDVSIGLSKIVTKKKRKRRTRFVYHGGEDYPGVKLGHRNCNIIEKPVPATMGWLWTTKPEGVCRRRRGWRPGVVTKIIQDRIRDFREKRGIPEPPALAMLLPKKKTLHMYKSEETEIYEAPEQKPTLVIERKNGNYLITVNPLKDPKTVADNEDPYIPCKPMQFVIVKPQKPSRIPVEQQAQLQNENDYMGEDEDSFYDNFYKTCFCDEDGEIIESSSDSELNIEFTTPAGILIPEKMKQIPNVVHADTQFKEEDFTCSSCPVIISKYSKKPKGKVKLKGK